MKRSQDTDVFADPASEDDSVSSSPPSIETTFSRSPSLNSTLPSSISLDRRKSIDEEIEFPCYSNTDCYTDETADRNYPNQYSLKDPAPDPLPSPSPEWVDHSPGIRPLADDSVIRDQPTYQVDYLSHDWREEDIWASWRLIVSRRKEYGQVSRLENASWRTWAKTKYNLKTVSPEMLNWLKDCDVTWLYGPLQEASSHRGTSESNSQLSKTNSFLDKKPILKKRNLSEVMLQKSLSTSSLVKQAAASVQAQRSATGDCGRSRGAPVNGRIVSDTGTPLNSVIYADASDSTGYLPSESSSGLRSPDPNAKKHISFNEKVEQCIAVDFKQPELEEEEDDDDDFAWTSPIEESSDDELIMRSSTKKHISASNSQRNSFSQEGKTIQILEPTTLKCHAYDARASTPVPSDRRLATSSSQETLRPSRPYANFLLEDDEDAGMTWEPSGAFYKGGTGADSYDAHRGRNSADQDSRGMRRTASGMFMPFDEDTGLPSTGILGRFVDTVNTARDIAHVIWNVGWRQ